MRELVRRWKANLKVTQANLNQLSNDKYSRAQRLTFENLVGAGGSHHLCVMHETHPCSITRRLIPTQTKLLVDTARQA